MDVTYPSPIDVNGFACRNCSEADMAKRHVDPAHPRSGPGNVDAATDPSRMASDPIKVEAARKVADTKANDIVGYSRIGATTAAIGPGIAFTLAA